MNQGLIPPFSSLVIPKYTLLLSTFLRRMYFQLGFPNYLQQTASRGTIILCLLGLSLGWEGRKSAFQNVSSVRMKIIYSTFRQMPTNRAILLHN
jgi:hypothetical protein